MTEPETLLQHAQFLRGLARGLLGASDQAGDVVQQTWLAALENGPRQPEKARAWLATTLRNFVRMSYRGQARRIRREEVAARPESVVSTDEIAERTELQRRVAEAVHELEEPYRTTIVLRYLEERTTAEIARTQGVPLKTVQTRLRRGLENLRGRLDASYGGNRKTWAMLLVPLAWPSTASAVTSGVASGAATGTFWIVLMKPKFILPFLLALALGSSFLVHATLQRGESDVARRTADEPVSVADNSGAPKAKTPDRPTPTPTAQENTLLLRGFVRTGDGTAVEGAVVTPGSWGDGDRWRSTGTGVRSDSSGAFTVAVGRDTGSGVSVIHPDYVPQRAWITPPPAEPGVVTLRVGVRMAILVVSPELEAVAGASIDVSHQEQNQDGMWSIEEIATTTSDEAGRAPVVRVPKGTIAVGVEHPDYADRVVHFEIDGDSERTVVLKTGGSIAGRVLDRRGKPVAGVLVRDSEKEDGVVTDHAGRFRLESLAPGWIDLVASAEGYGTARFGSAHGWHEATPVPVRDRRTTRGIDLILRDPTWLSGRIIDEQGKPLAGVPVEAYVNEEVRTKTDANGRFRVALGVEREDTASLTFRFNERWHLDDMTDILLREGEERDLADLRATTLATLSGRVIDEQGEPVAQGWVATALNLVGIRGGRFEMQVRPGIQHIRVRAKSESGPLLATGRVEAAPGARLDNLTFTVKRAAVIRGRLVSTDGSPSARHWVMAVRVGVPLPAPRNLHASAIAARDGTFELAVHDEAEYRVGLFEPADGRSMARLAADPPPAIVKAGAAPITLVVPNVNGIVTGQVLSGPARRPVEHYEARLVEYRNGLPWSYSIITARDREGRFRFDDATGGSRYAMEIAAAEHGIYRSDVFALRGGQTLTLRTIVLAAQGHVRGRVVDAAGLPVPFARVAILGPRLETNITRPVTDLDGRFAPIAFAPGEHRLVAFIPSAGIGVVSVRIDADRTTDVEITLPPRAPLVVEVRDAAGRPVRDVPVTFEADAIAPLSSELMFRLFLHGHPGQSYRTNARGELRVGFLPAGKTRISVRGKRRAVELVADTETRVEFQVE